MLSFSKRDSSLPLQAKPTLEKDDAPKRYELYISESEILIRNRADAANLLLIDRKSLSSRFLPGDALGKYKTEKPLPIFGIYGRIEINGIMFVIVISKASAVAKIGPNEIFKIESAKFLTLNREQYKNFDYESCWDRLERIKNFLRSGFYFSYGYKLQSDFAGSVSFDARAMMRDFNSSPFIWNFRALKTLVLQRDPDYSKPAPEEKARPGRLSEEPKVSEKDKFAPDSPSNLCHFFMPVIQGFVGSVEVGDIKVVLISRRSAVMGGTRYNSRGSDNMGNVANFVQTEQLVFFREKVFTFNQIRGSLPFYWEQQKGLINPRPAIHQREEVNADLLSKHVRLALGAKYTKLVFFNLLSHNKADEEVLNLYLVRLLEQVIHHPDFKDKVFYEHVDFHAITKQADFSNIDKYIYNIYNLNGVKYNLFQYEELMDGYEPSERQTIQIRTNCLDCLDRTNAVQTKFGFYALYKILGVLNSGLMQHFAGDWSYEPLKVFESAGSAFFEGVRQLWADNGDAISRIYTGTGATTSSVTRKGDKSALTSFLDHKLKTLSRFYLNTFDDDFKQEIIDILLHKKSSSIRQSSVFLSQFETGKQEYMKISFVTLFSTKSNSNLSVDEKMIESVFLNSQDSDLILVICRMDKAKTIGLISESHNYLIYGSFNELFKSLFKQLHGFVLTDQSSESKFELSVFATQRNPKALSYFKADRVSISALSQNLGSRISFIVNNTGIELFCLKLEQSTFGYAPTRSLEKVFEKYIDREYDLVFVAGYIEDTQFEPEKASRDYELVLQEIRKGKNDGRFSNHLILYCSKSVIQTGHQPLYAPMAIDMAKTTEDVTINAHSFIVNRFK